MKSILSEQQLSITIRRLAQQILENHLDISNSIFLGVQPRGIFVSDRLVGEIRQQVGESPLQYGKLSETKIPRG